MKKKKKKHCKRGQTIRLQQTSGSITHHHRKQELHARLFLTPPLFPRCFRLFRCQFGRVSYGSCGARGTTPRSFPVLICISSVATLRSPFRCVRLSHRVIVSCVKRSSCTNGYFLILSSCLHSYYRFFFFCYSGPAPSHFGGHITNALGIEKAHTARALLVPEVVMI